MGLFCNQNQSDCGQEHTDDLPDGNGFPIDQNADEKQNAGKGNVCDQTCDADFPSCTVDADKTELQGDDCDAQSKSSPVGFGQFCGQIPVFGCDEEQEQGTDSCNGIGYRQRSEGTDVGGSGFCGDVINRICADDDQHGPE